MEDWVTIRNLKSKENAPSNREIARFLGISHNTVKYALIKDTRPKYTKAKVINPELESFIDFIEVSLIDKNLCKSRILNDIISKGYIGSKSAFYRHCHSIKPVEIKVFQPYETSPGEQAQFDWAHYTVIINGVLSKVYVYCYILGFSRYRIYKVSLSQTAGDLLMMH